MSGPWEQFQTAGRVVDSGSEGPWAKFAAQPTKPPLAASYGDVDFTQPVETVREGLAKLPQADRQKALDAWAAHYVANESNGKSAGQNALSSVNNVIETVARGSPVGSWGDEFDAWLKDKAYSISGIGAPYDETLAYNRARHKAFDEANPKTALALKLGGAVATLPLSPTAPIVGGASMLGRIANGMANGAAYGAAYGAGEGNDASSRISEAAKGTVIGAGIGGAAVPVAQGIGNAAKYVMDKGRGIPPAIQQFNRPAIDRVSRAMQGDNLHLSPPNAQGPMVTNYSQRAAELGDEGMLGDMGRNLLSQVQGIASQPGRGQTILADALEGRRAGAAGRIAADTDAVLGPAQNLVQLENSIMGSARRNADPLYEQFHSTPIKINENLYGILDRAQANGLLDRARKAMATDGYDPSEVFYKGYANSGVDNSALNARFLDYVKQEIDDVASKAFQTGADKEGARFARLAEALRSEVDSILSPQNPAQSIWAQARAASGEGFQFRDALEEGQAAFSRATHPDQLASDLAGMNPVRRQAYTAGARGQVRDVMGDASSVVSSPEQGIAAATAARKALGSQYARQKLEQVIQPPQNYNGPPRAPAGQLTARLDAEGTFANKHQRAFMGSDTAARLAAQKEFPNAAVRNELAAEQARKGPGGIAVEIALRSVNALLGGALDARMARTVTDAARMLAAQGASRDRIAQALMLYARNQAVSAQGRAAITQFATSVLNAPRTATIDAAQRRPALEGTVYPR